jgi:hypothetical protein
LLREQQAEAARFRRFHSRHNEGKEKGVAAIEHTGRPVWQAFVVAEPSGKRIVAGYPGPAPSQSGSNQPR